MANINLVVYATKKEAKIYKQRGKYQPNSTVMKVRQKSTKIVANINLVVHVTKVWQKSTKKSGNSMIFPFGHFNLYLVFS